MEGKGFIITNKSHLYFILVEKDENTIFYDKNFDFVNSLTEKSYLSVLRQTQSLYTSFAFCFHAVFYIIYSSLLFQIDTNCNNGCEKICPNSLHYYFNYEKIDSHASIEGLLGLKNLAEVKVNGLYAENEIKHFCAYFEALYNRMLYLPDVFLDENCFAKIRKDSFSSSKKLLGSIRRDFENDCCTVVD